MVRIVCERALFLEGETQSMPMEYEYVNVIGFLRRYRDRSFQSLGLELPRCAEMNVSSPTMTKPNPRN